MVERSYQPDEIIDELTDVLERLRGQQPSRLRPLLTKTPLNARGILVIGPRGTGKTTFLLEKAKQENLFYLSADSPLVSRAGLWELGKAVFQRDYNGIIFDEVHFAPNWSRDLKGLYDAYPRKKIIASDSSSTILQKGLADLSRRFIKIQIPFLSFRDYLFLKEEKTLPSVDILKPDLAVVRKIHDQGPVMHWFREYLEGGFRPLFLEGNYAERQRNIIEKTVFSDLPFFLPQTNENILRLGNAVIGMLATSSIPTLNVESTCRDWGVGKETFYNLLSALEALALIRIIDFKKSKKAKTKGAKIFFADPSHYAVLGGDKGNLREAYVALELESRFGDVFASKDEKKGDFESGGFLFEVGSKSKKRKQADFVIRDDLEFPVQGQIPLWMLGLRPDVPGGD